MRAAKDSMERWNVDKEHNKCPACKNPDEVVQVANNGFPEREFVFRLHRKNLCGVGIRRCENIRMSLLTLKHCVKNTDRYTENVLDGWAHSFASHTYQSTGPVQMPQTVDVQ